MADSTDNQALGVVAWNFSWDDGWDEFCKPGDLPSEWDETPTIEALVRLSDHQRIVAERDAEIARLKPLADRSADHIVDANKMVEAGSNEGKAP